MEGTAYPRLAMILQDFQKSSYQDFASCSNCHYTLSPGTSAFRFTDTFSPTSNDKHGSSSVTIIQALDIVFEVTRKSCFSKIMLDVDHYALCWECADVLLHLYEMYIDFTKRSQDPSFMNSIIVQNKPLFKYRKCWDGTESLEVIKSEPHDSCNDATSGDGETWILGLDDNRCNSPDEEYRPSPSPPRRTSQRIRRPPPKLRKLPAKVRVELSPKSKREKKYRYECSECEAKFYRSHSLKTHMDAHSATNYVCPTCNGGFRTAYLLVRHVASFHKPPDKDISYKPRIHTCPECHMEFQHASKLVSHERVHSNSSEFTCWDCGARFKNRASVTRHQKAMHNGDKKVEQPLLVPETPDSEVDEDEEITSNSEIDEPNSSFKSERVQKYKCSECPDKFRRSEHLTRHIHVHSNGKYYCEICRAGFITGKYLERHLLRVHKNLAGDQLKSISDAKKKFKCTECDISFTRNGNRRLHMKTVHQLDDVSKECEICGLTLSSQIRLERHMDRVHRPSIIENKCTCEFCGKSYQNRDTLRKHRISHREDRMTLNCDSCSYSSKYRYLLSRHKQLVHIATKPHLCPVCGTAFKSKHQLRLHTVRHGEAEVRPFRCSYPDCGKAFRRQANLHQHIQLHKGARFDCKECGASFSRKGYLKVHYNVVHLGLSGESRPRVKRIRKRKIVIKPGLPETADPLLIDTNLPEIIDHHGPDLNNVAREENVLILPESHSPLHFQIIPQHLSSSTGVNFVTLDGGSYAFYAPGGEVGQTAVTENFTN